MFRGYVATRNKRCLEKFKDVERLKTYEEVKHLREFAGILDGETILLDFDDEVQAQKAFKIVQDMKLKCCVRKTGRGMHIFFKNRTVDRCSTATRLACGLRADIKVGRNSYAIVKHKGQERPILYDSGVYEEVPRFFTPLSSPIELMNLKEGESRNTNLYKYILPLQKHEFSKEEARQCLNIINQYVFDEPLPESEMQTILRDESFMEEVTPAFFDKKTFLFDKFAEYIRDKASIVKINGRLHIYRDGVYVDSTDYIENAMITIIKSLNDTKRKEVLKYLNLLILDNVEPSPARYIAFKNGVLDIFKNELLPFSEKLILTNKINFNYTPGAYSELVDSTLTKLACGDEEIRALLEEAVGYCFYRRNELGKAFILVGDGTREKGASNGKSTFLDMVKTLLGEDNICSLDLADLNREFHNAEVFGKLANIGDDIDDGYIPSSAVFKKLVTGERIQVSKKYQDPFGFSNYAKLLFSANEIPKIKDRGGAIQRRLVIIPFLAHFSKNDPDYRPFIKYELQEPECIEYLIQLGVQGLRRVLENNCFTESNKVQIQLEEFEETNNPLVGFFKENPELEVENQTNTSIYSLYTEYCLANNHHPLSKIAFSKQIKLRFGVEMVHKHIDGKTQRVFIRK